MSPLLREYGITRVADVTGLDNIGIPVMLAVRPRSEILAVSQGKGATPLLARLSAVMESIELWHAERLPVPMFSARARDLELGYRLSDVGALFSNEFLERIEIPWVHAVPIGGSEEARAPVAVPADIVQLSGVISDAWRPRLFPTTSNGLASGNTLEEACLHALYETVERDVTSTLVPGGADDRVHIDLDSLTDPHLQDLVARLQAAEVSLEVIHIPNRYGLATFAAYIWSPLFPRNCAGAGTHSDAVVAMSRAVTEAVQTRLTRISGTRDDIPSDYEPQGTPDPGMGRQVEFQRPFAEAVEGYHRSFSDSRVELRTVAAAVAQRTGHAPLMVDLSRRPDLFSVVRVICPGLQHTIAQQGGHGLVR